MEKGSFPLFDAVEMREDGKGVGGNLSPGPTKNHFPRLGGKLGEKRHSSMKFIIFPLLITISLSLSYLNFVREHIIIIIIIF